MLDKLASLPMSRRFWAAVIALTTIVMKDWLGLSPESANAIAGILCTWLVGDSLCRTGGTTVIEEDVDADTGETVVTRTVTN